MKVSAIFLGLLFACVIPVACDQKEDPAQLGAVEDDDPLLEKQFGRYPSPNVGYPCGTQEDCAFDNALLCDTEMGSCQDWRDYVPSPNW
jgi:hypothetical protein